MVQEIQMVLRCPLVSSRCCCVWAPERQTKTKLTVLCRTYTCIGIVPVAGDVVKELKGSKDREATVLFVTIWELGEATGPLFIAPLSELFGRFVVYNIANCLFIAGIVITATSQDLGLLIFARFLTGCAVAANVLNPAIIGDMFPSESRGAAMSAVMLAPLIGGALGYVYLSSQECFARAFADLG